MRVRRGARRVRVGVWCALACVVVALATALVTAVNQPPVTGLSLLHPAGLDAVAYGPLPEQVLDVHRRADAPDLAPVVVYAHPGGFSGGSRADVPGFIDTLGAELGVAVVSIDYRVVGTGADGRSTNAFPTAVSDLDRAIRFVRLHAHEWGLDPERILVAGGSAGAHLAALVAADPGRFAAPDLPPALARVSPAVQGLIDYVGPSDFHTLWQAGGWAPPITVQYLDCPERRVENCDPARVAEATVTNHLHGRPPPALFVYGKHDGLVVPATQGVPLAAAWARARGETTTTGAGRKGTWYEELADAGHNITPEIDPLLVVSWCSLVLDGTLR